MWMVYRCFCKCFDTIVKPKNAELTDLETEIFHIKAQCNSFLEEHQRCYLCEFPLEAKVLNEMEKPKSKCSHLDFVLRKEYQFLQNVLSKNEIAGPKHLQSLKSYYEAMSFLLKADEFFHGQAEYSVVLQPEKVNREYKEFIVEYMGDCSTVEHLHNKIKEFKIYRNKSAPPCQMAFALMYSRYTDFPRDMLLFFLVI